MAWLLLIAAVQGDARLYLEPSAMAERIRPLLVDALGSSAIVERAELAAFVLAIGSEGEEVVLALDNRAGDAILVRRFKSSENLTPALRSAAVAVEEAISAELALRAKQRPKIARAPAPVVEQPVEQPAAIAEQSAEPTAEQPAPIAAQPAAAIVEQPAAAIVEQPPTIIDPPADQPARTPEPLPATIEPAPAAAVTPTRSTFRIAAGAGLVWISGPQPSLDITIQAVPLGFVDLGIAASATGFLCCAFEAPLADGTAGLEGRVQVVDLLAYASTTPIELDAIQLGLEAGLGAAYHALDADPVAFIGEAGPEHKNDWVVSGRAGVLAEVAFTPLFSARAAAGLRARSGSLHAELPDRFPKGNAVLDTAPINPYLSVSVLIRPF